jgi:DNA-binding transcriptional regulator LsrR (DeoR family)
VSDYSVKLTAESATDLRRLYWGGGHTQAELAGRFGISAAQAWQIIHRKAWIHEPYVPNEPARTN